MKSPKFLLCSIAHRCVLLLLIIFLSSRALAQEVLYVAEGGGIFNVTSGDNFGSQPIFVTSPITSPTSGILGLTANSSGYLFATNPGLGTVYKISPNGIVTTIATGLSNPFGIALDSSDNVFVTNLDLGVSGGSSIIKITPSDAITTFATGLFNPVFMTIDGSNNLYVSNQGNNTISKITPSGTLSAFAPGINGPEGLAFDSSGNLFVSSDSNNIYKVTPSGVTSLFATTTLPQSSGLVFDASGNLLVSNRQGQSILEVTPGGSISTYAFNVYNQGPPEGLVFVSPNIPEPETWSLFAGGFALALVAGIRKRQALQFTLAP